MVYYPQKLTNSLANSNKATMLVKLRNKILIMPVTMPSNCDEKLEAAKKHIDNFMKVDLSICNKNPEPTRINRLFGEKFNFRDKCLEEDIKIHSNIIEKINSKGWEIYFLYEDLRKCLVNNVAREYGTSIILPQCMIYSYNVMKKMEDIIKEARKKFLKTRRNLKKELSSILK